jgi:uncharacterized coiled-coil protein SlyX
MFQECRHIKSSGTKCEAPALKGEQFCYFHSRSRSRAHTRRHRDHWQAIEIPLLEDRSAIQRALTEVACAIANHNMDTKRAGLLLSLLLDRLSQDLERTLLNPSHWSAANTRPVE